MILSLDTTTRAGSCALWRGDALIEERVGDATRTHAERLPGDLADLLAAHGLRVGDVDLYAVASGPGSFTGLRVGIATIQGLALVHDRKVVPISALEALTHSAVRALSSSPPAIVGAWMEAYRGEVFGALYRIAAADEAATADGADGAGGAGAAGDDAADTGERKPEQGMLVRLEELAPPAVAAPATLAAEWQRLWPRDAAIANAHPAGRTAGRPTTTAIIGDAVPGSRTLLEAAFPDAQLLDAIPLAGTIAQLAHAHPDRAVRPHAIVPLYVRRPDAEIARDRPRQPVSSPTV